MSLKVTANNNHCDADRTRPAPPVKRSLVRPTEQRNIGILTVYSSALWLGLGSNGVRGEGALGSGGCAEGRAVQRSHRGHTPSAYDHRDNRVYRQSLSRYSTILIN